MGMPCEVNSILKLSVEQGYPAFALKVGNTHQGFKDGYRIYPIDVPIQLVDQYWKAYADVIIRSLKWEDGKTYLKYEIVRVFDDAFELFGEPFFLTARLNCGSE